MLYKHRSSLTWQQANLASQLGVLFFPLSLCRTREIMLIIRSHGEGVLRSGHHERCFIRLYLYQLNANATEHTLSKTRRKSVFSCVSSVAFVFSCTVFSCNAWTEKYHPKTSRQDHCGNISKAILQSPLHQPTHSHSNINTPQSFVYSNPVNNTHHSHLTRFNNHIWIPSSKHAFFNHCPNHLCTKIYNKLPQSTKASSSLSLFKFKLKSFLLSKSYYSLNEFLSDKFVWFPFFLTSFPNWNSWPAVTFNYLFIHTSIFLLLLLPLFCICIVFNCYVLFVLVYPISIFCIDQWKLNKLKAPVLLYKHETSREVLPGKR
jgi:hypothetical protein